MEAGSLPEAEEERAGDGIAFNDRFELLARTFLLLAFRSSVDQHVPAASNLLGDLLADVCNLL